MHAVLGLQLGSGWTISPPDNYLVIADNWGKLRGLAKVHVWVEQLPVTSCGQLSLNDLHGQLLP